MLPVSLFGLSVAAAELPELARLRDRDAGARRCCARRAPLARRMAFLNAPTTVGYLAFGFLIVGALYRTGTFGVADTWLVYLVLAATRSGSSPRPRRASCRTPSTRWATRARRRGPRSCGWRCRPRSRCR